MVLRYRRLSLLLLILLLLVTGALAADDPIVNLLPTDATYQEGETATVAVVMDTVPTGLSGFNVTFALTDPPVGEIIAVTYPSWASMPVNSSLPADSVYVQAVDLMSSVGAGATNVTLCTLNVRGDAAGTTNLTITTTKIDDDVGGRYEPAIVPASITVGIIPTPTPTPTPSPVQVPELSFNPVASTIVSGDAVQYALEMNTVPTGLSGFNVTITLTNSSVGKFIWVSYPPWASMPVNSSLPADSVYVQAVDLMSSVGSGAVNVTLCTLNVRGDTAGTTNLTITATKIDDDVGGRYAPVTSDAVLVVESSMSLEANFTADITSGIVPLTVHFSDASSGNPTAWLWAFGDNATSTDQNPTHAYTAAGTYTVNLTVTNNDGSDTCSREGFIAVLDPMHVGLGNVKAEKGAVTTAYLTISNATAIGAADLNLTYDPSVVTVDSVSSAFKIFASNIDNENGIIHINFADYPGLNGDVQICTIALNATGEPGDVSSLEVTIKELIDINGDDLSYVAVPVPGVFQVLYPVTPDPTRYYLSGDLYKGIGSGNTIYLGEEGLNLTHLGDVRRLVYAGNLSSGIDVPDPGSFDPVYDGDFVPGHYYAWGADGQISGEPWVEIREPEATLDVVQNGTTDSVHNSSVTRTADLAFTFENNLDGLYTSPAASFVTIEVTTHTGETTTWFGGRNLTGIPVNTTPIVLNGFDLTDTAAGTYTVRAVWPSSSDFAGKGYDSNTVAFEIVDRPLGLEASTEAVVRSHPFTVTVTGDNARQYILYVVDAGLEQENDYPLIATGQTGVQTGDDVPAPAEAVNFSRTKAYVVTDSGGNRTVRFETTTLTANRTFTLMVFDSENSQNAAEVQVRIEKGEVSITAPGDAEIGDEIVLTGINTDGTMTYLFLTGPGLPTSGVNTVNLSAAAVSDDPSTFTVVAVEIDETWEYIWDTASVWGGALHEGTYTVYAVAQPKALADLDGVPYASTAIRFVSPTQEGNVSFTADRTSGVAPLTVRFIDTSANSPTSWSWTFGDGTTSTDQNPTHTYTAPGNYTVTLAVNGGEDTCTRPAYIAVTPVLYGDANEDGTVNQADTLRVLKQVVGLSAKPAVDTERFTKTDVHRNGAIEVGDALFIAQYNVGLRDAWFEMRA